jgi:hypothetical protein
VKDLLKLRAFMITSSFFYAVYALFCLLGGLIMFLVYIEFFRDGNGPDETIGYAPLLLIGAIVLIDILLIVAASIVVFFIRRRAMIPRSGIGRNIPVLVLILLSAAVFSIFTGQRIGLDHGYMYPVPTALCILVAINYIMVNIPGSLLIDSMLPVRRTLRFNTMLPVAFALLFSMAGLLYLFDEGPYRVIFITFEYLIIGSVVATTLFCIIRYSSVIESSIKERVDASEEQGIMTPKRLKKA